MSGQPTLRYVGKRYRSDPPASPDREATTAIAAGQRHPARIHRPTHHETGEPNQRFRGLSRITSRY